jgi:N-acetylmuramoyl-L-alanine amidase
MAKLTHLIIHCLATPKGREYTSDQLKIMHLGPALLDGGKVKYMRKVYNSASELPNETIGGMTLQQIVKIGGGRGWTQVGYADMLHLDGRIENVVPYNNDDNVDPWELTNGTLSTNPTFYNSRHMVYVGGMDADNKNPEDTRTREQLAAMLQYVQKTILKHPNIIVAGHNQFDNRACPSFSVVQWMLAKGFDRKNICGLSMVYKSPLKNVQ